MALFTTFRSAVDSFLQPSLISEIAVIHAISNKVKSNEIYQKTTTQISQK